MTGVVVRLVLAALCWIVAVRLLRIAAVTRRAWRIREASLDRAEAWWDRTHGGPFDQTRTEVPAEVAPFLGPHGPRTELRESSPALAHLVWGWLLLGLGALIALTAAAQVASGTA